MRANERAQAGENRRVDGREKERKRETEEGREAAGESEGRTYRIRVYAPKRGRPRRGSRSALTYCSTFVVQSSLSELRSGANPETQNSACPCTLQLRYPSTANPLSFLPTNPSLFYFLFLASSASPPLPLYPCFHTVSRI